MVCIGLFGTCGNSTWRKDFIEVYEKLHINFFNPQVEDWKEEMAQIEAEHLVNDDIILFPVTSETYGTGSLAEIGFSIMQALRSNKNRSVVILIDKDLDENLKIADPDAAKGSIRTRALVRAHLQKVNHPNVYIVNTMKDLLDLSVDLYSIHHGLSQLKEKYKV